MMIGEAMCVAKAASENRTGACSECSCKKCLDKIMNCQDAACASVVACGQKSGCKGRACYCGDQNPLDCALSGAKGPCVMEIAAAAGICGTSPTSCAQMLAQVTDPTSAMYDADNPVSRANQTSICTRGQKAEAATAVTPAVMEIAGMCQAECGG